MYHSVNLGDINTYDDWKLIPSSRPVIAPPSVKTKYVDVPGMNGSIDMTTILTGLPTYNDREGSIEFYVLNDYVDWRVRYDQIMNAIQGKYMKVSLEDDPEFYYQGRVWVSDWKSDKDYSMVTLKYKLSPFKWSRLKTTDDWEWDPFSFDDGIIYQAFFSDISITAGTSKWQEIDISADVVGGVPVCPTFRVTGSVTSMRFVNSVMNIDETVTLKTGANQFSQLMFSNSNAQLYFKGTGTVSIEFNIGRI